MNARHSKPKKGVSSDSRSLIVEQRRAQDRAQQLPLHATSAQRAKLLRELELRYPCQEQRILAALRLGDFTSEELGPGLGVSDQHARLNGLRRAGLPIIDLGFVSQHLRCGRTAPRKLYRLLRDQ